MNSGSSAFMRSGGQVVGWSATTLCHQRSRRVSKSIAPSVWRSTRTFSTDPVSGRRRAASTFAFSGTVLPPRRPSSAVMTSLLWLSAMRSAMECGAKPPNTTVCTAPMRAQASIAIAASGIIGR